MSWSEYIDNLAELIQSQRVPTIDAESIQPVSRPQPADPITNLDDIQKVKDYFLNTGRKFNAVRNYTIFCFGISTGLRCMDIFHLTVGDILNSDGSIRDELSVCESKTHKMNHPVLNKDLKVVLIDYLNERNKSRNHKIMGNWEYLFPSNKTGCAMDTQSWSGIIKKAGKDLGLPYNLGCHTMRKTFAYWTIKQHYYDQNILFSLQEMLNHSSMLTTLHYSGHTKEHLNTMYQDMSKVLDGTAQDNTKSEQEKKIDTILELLSGLQLSQGDLATVIAKATPVPTETPEETKEDKVKDDKIATFSIKFT